MLSMGLYLILSEILSIFSEILLPLNDIVCIHIWMFSAGSSYSFFDHVNSGLLIENSLNFFCKVDKFFLKIIHLQTVGLCSCHECLASVKGSTNSSIPKIQDRMLSRCTLGLLTCSWKMWQISFRISRSCLLWNDSAFLWSTGRRTLL